VFAAATVDWRKKGLKKIYFCFFVKDVFLTQNCRVLNADSSKEFQELSVFKKSALYLIGKAFKFATKVPPAIFLAAHCSYRVVKFV
jgi:hypothetical protein